MAVALHPFQIGDVARADFRTSAACDAANGRLQKALGFAYRYQPARLAIGLSLGMPDEPAVPSDALGKPIRGDTLFGQDEADVALWAGILVERLGRPAVTRRDLQDAASAHWGRGVAELERRLAECGGAGSALLARLAGAAAV